MWARPGRTTLAAEMSKLPKTPRKAIYVERRGRRWVPPLATCAVCGQDRPVANMRDEQCLQCRSVTPGGESPAQRREREERAKKYEALRERYEAERPVRIEAEQTERRFASAPSWLRPLLSLWADATPADQPGSSFDCERCAQQFRTRQALVAHSFEEHGSWP
jgi:hypothetical protein